MGGLTDSKNGTASDNCLIETSTFLPVSLTVTEILIAQAE